MHIQHGEFSLFFSVLLFFVYARSPDVILTMQNEFASQSTGALLRDSNAGLCRATAPGLTTCPATDLGGFALGSGSGARGSTLYCTYPASAELASTRYYCDYSASPVDLPLCSPSDSRSLFFFLFAFRMSLDCCSMTRTKGCAVPPPRAPRRLSHP